MAKRQKCICGSFATLFINNTLYCSKCKPLPKPEVVEEVSKPEVTVVEEPLVEEPVIEVVTTESEIEESLTESVSTEDIVEEESEKKMSLFNKFNWRK